MYKALLKFIKLFIICTPFRTNGYECSIKVREKLYKLAICEIILLNSTLLTKNLPKTFLAGEKERRWKQI